MGAGIKPPIAAEMDYGTQALCQTSGKRRVRSSIIPCSISDHVALGMFLEEIFGGSHPAEFQASLDDPLYAPRDRLSLRRMGSIIAHVHVTRRMMQFGSLAIPVAGLQGLATAENCRLEGLGTHLLVAAEKKMAQSGAFIGLLRTRIPHFFRRTGWALCGGSSCSASPYAVLARLLDQGRCMRRTSRIQVRPWRRWEENAIARVYQQGLAGSYGMLERSRPYWHWLLERRAYDQFYVALDGPDLWDFNESSTRLIGYAAVRGDRIVELVTAPDRRKAAIELLARACGDAIEQDQCRISIQAPADSPFMEFFRGEEESPACTKNSEHAEVCMARLLDPLGLLRVMCGLFEQRAAAAGLVQPLELGLLVDGQKYRIELAGRGRALADSLGRSYLRLNVADFTRLLLGQLDWDRALEERRVVPSTGLALEAGRALFPSLPFWRPMLDDVRA